jgi:DNA-binding transcriptional ArsR family regulator
MPARTKSVQQADADVFTAIAHPVRRQILELLQSGERTANELAEPFDISRSAVSQHLGILSGCGLVTRSKVGRAQIYRLQPDHLGEVQRWIMRFEQLWPQKLDALESLLHEMKREEEDEP